MADLVQFVDSISSSPTVRLDVSDEAAGWAVRRFMAPPPRLRRAMASNAMRDGINVSASSYDGRTLILDLECIKNDQDSAATELQKLARELDQPTNFIKYQPNGLTKPVFFVTFRADVSDLLDMIAQKAFRQVTIEVPAEPFALGLQEPLGPFTVTNDPAAGSNGCYFDASGVLGDVPAPLVLINTTRCVGYAAVATRSRGNLANLVWFLQAESMTLGTDTTNPGGGPDAAMSGTGTNNFARTSFATTATSAVRVSQVISTTSYTSAQRSELVGTFRLMAVVRRSDATSDMTASAELEFVSTGPDVTIPKTTSRQLIDLGVLTFAGARVGYGSAVSPFYQSLLQVSAARSSGSGTLDWDLVLLVPADESLMLASMGGHDGSSDQLVDSVAERVYAFRAAAGGAFGGGAEQFGRDAQVSGGFPSLVPGVTNRVFFIETEGAGAVMTKSETNSLTAYYWPRYLYVRPVAS